MEDPSQKKSLGSIWQYPESCMFEWRKATIDRVRGHCPTDFCRLTWKSLTFLNFYSLRAYLELPHNLSYKYQTYLLTPRCRVLLEQLCGLQLVKKFPAPHGTRMFITALTSIRHLSLSWASPIQSIYPNPTSCRSLQIPNVMDTKLTFTPLFTVLITLTSE